MEYFFLIVFTSLCIHFIMDYPFQGDFLAKFKSRHALGDDHNPFWIHCLTAHSAIHAFPYLALFGNVYAAGIMFVTHWIIDFLKCENYYSIHVDQILHIIVIVILCLTFDFHIPWIM